MARLNEDVLADLGVSTERFQDLLERVRGDPQATALEAGITMTSLQELASFNGSVHDDAINRFLEIVVPDTSLYRGRPLSWVPSTFTATLGCTGDQRTRAEATALVSDMARELHGRHLEGTTLVPMHISSGHWVLVTVNKVDSTQEVTILDSLGAHRAQTRLLQAQQLATWFQSQHADATTAVFKFNPRFLPLQIDSYACGAMVCVYCYYIAKKGRLPTDADFTGANQQALRYFVLHTI